METNEYQITIIEGPPPTFENVIEGWVYGVIDSPNLADVAVTRLRTFNGNALIERCYRAWHSQNSIQLVFRNPDGLQEEVPIVAARNVESDDGDMLLLWVRLPNDEVELEIGYDDDIDDEEDFE